MGRRERGNLAALVHVHPRIIIGNDSANRERESRDWNFVSIPEVQHADRWFEEQWPRYLHQK